MNNLNTIVLDIDGTLLNREKKISPKTKAALIRVQEHGIKVILASGRPTSAMKQFAHELEMDKHHGFLVSFNGACVVDCESDTILYAQPILPTVGKDLLNHLKQYDVIPMIGHEKTMYVNDVFNGMINTSSMFNKTGELTNIIQYESRGGHYLLCEVEDLAEFVDFPLFKVLIAADPAYLQANYQAIMAPFSQQLNCVFSAPFYFEFTDKGIDKATTLQNVLAPLGHHQEQIMAFGDGHNDLSMLEYAGIGVAMGNAEKEVLEIANQITASNNEDGIALTLYEAFPDLFK